MPTVSDLRKKLIKEMPSNLAHIEKTIYPDFAELDEWNKKTTIDVEVKSVSTYHDGISIYDRFHYVNSSLHGMPNVDLLTRSARAGIAALFYTIPVYDYHPKNLKKYRLSDFREMFPIVLANGWKDYGELVARLAFKYFNTVLNEGIEIGRLGWFMISLAEDWLKPKHVNLNTDFRKTEVQSLGSIWDDALQNWRTTDLDAFDQLISRVIEFHLSQTETKIDEEYDDEIDGEFADRYLWIWPIEVLAILRLREWHGLINPPLSHPIFSATPLAKLNPPTEWPQDDLMDAAEKRFRSIYPNTPSINDLAQLRKEQS